MDIDNSTIEEGLSRLKSIRQQKRFEAFLSTVEEDIKPVIDTSLNRNVTDESDFLSHSAKSHIERLTGEHAFVGYSFVCSLSHSLIHSFILSFSPSFIHSLLLSFTHSLIHSGRIWIPIEYSCSPQMLQTRISVSGIWRWPTWSIQINALTHSLAKPSNM